LKNKEGMIFIHRNWATCLFGNVQFLLFRSDERRKKKRKERKTEKNKKQNIKTEKEDKRDNRKDE